jgi:membrane protein involved in colicin uptake
MKNTNDKATKIDQAAKAAIVKADYYAEVAKIAIENADKDAQAAKDAIANANETAQVAKRDGDSDAIAKADYYAKIAKDAIVKADASAEIAKSAIEDANETAQVAKNAIEDANKTAQITDVIVVDAIDTAKIQEDSGTIYKLDEVTGTSDKGNSSNYFGKDTGKGINFIDVFISDDILIVQYTEGTQYIDEPHANGFLGNATLEKVPTILTTDLEPEPVKFCGNSYMDMNVQDFTIL